MIGAGSAGLVSAYIGAAVKAKVTLVEKHKMGGDCLNFGCVPSKALIRSAKFLSHVKRAREFGVRSAAADFQFKDVMDRVHRVIRTVEPHDSVERYASLGVDVVQGEAKITSPWSVEIRRADGAKQTLTTRAIVIAAGAAPFVPPIPGIDEVGYVTSDTVWELRELPQRLVVLGGGPIGSELAQCFARLGSSVTQVEMLPRIMIKEDPGDLRDGRAPLPRRRHRRAREHQGQGLQGRQGREDHGRRARRQGRARSRSTCCCARWGASRAPRATGWKSSASRSRSSAPSR